MNPIKAVGFYLTLRCSAKCAHCYIDAGPDRTEEMPLADVLNWLDQIEPLEQISWISLIGGEPFLYPHLAEVCQKAREYDKKIKLYTNCYWANSLDIVMQRLQELKPSIIATSADKYHQRFVPLENVKNVIRACRALGITVLVGACDSGGIAAELVDEFGDTLRAATSAWIEPVGRASELPPIENADYVERFYQRACDVGGKIVVIKIDGSVISCCRSFATVNENSAFKIGNAYQSSLRSIIENVDPALSIPQTHSLHDLIKVVKMAGLCHRLRRGRPFVSNCDLCNHLMSDKLTRAAIEAAYGPECAG